jgi:hypothetical protein
MSGTAEGAAKARAKRAQKAVTGAVELEATAAEVKLLLGGVDWLDLFTVAELKPAVVTELRRLKAEAMERRDEGSAEMPHWTCNGIDFEVMPYGVKKAELVLRSDAMDVLLQPDGPRNLPRAYVELGNRALWDCGWSEAADLALELLGTVCAGDVDAQVSRLDMCVDFMGWQPAPSMLDSVVGRVVRRDTMEQPFIRTHHRGRRFTGFTFGGGKLLCRLYDKSTEIQVSNKLWFRPLWRKAGWVDDETSGRVWRLEFQLRRDPLTHATVDRNNEESELKSWEQVKAALDPLWQYLTTRWLSYRLPRTAEERVRIHPRWQTIQSARFTSAPDGELHRYRLEYSITKTTGAFAGYYLRLLSLWWERKGCVPYKPKNLDDFAELVKMAAEHYKEKHDGTELFDAAVKMYKQQQFLRRLFSGEKRRVEDAVYAGAEA